MKLDYSQVFLKSIARAPTKVQNAFKKQSLFLVQDLKYPSLHAKKYSESQNIWQARVDKSWRFYFTIKGDTYYLLDIIPHPK